MVADDWSKGGEPSPLWDRWSTAPMMAFPRFDLLASSYAVAIMGDVTPAWRELYADILDRLVARHTTLVGGQRIGSSAHRNAP